MSFAPILNELELTPAPPSPAASPRPSTFTACIHAGRTPDPTTGAIVAPIVQSTTYAQPALGVSKGFTYSRAANPTVEALERALAAVEGAEHALAFASGLAAETTLFLSLLRAGDHAVIGDVVYGGTVRLFEQVLAGLGVSASFVDASDTRALARAVTPRTRLVFVETPGNPTLKVTDIAVAARIAHAAGAILAVDNTFLTPVLQRPLELGADVAVYSTTKYIEGHNSAVGGAITTSRADLAERLRLVRKSIGCIQSPFDAWLTLNGLKSLPVRLARHNQSARRIAEWLAANPPVSRVYYPGLPGFAQREIVERQHIGGSAAGGGIVSFELAGGAPAVERFVGALRLCTLAENLGAVETLITHPATMTHADVPIERRNTLSITDGLIRLSVGLEDSDDIIADLERALEAADLVGSRADTGERANGVPAQPSLTSTLPLSARSRALEVQEVTR